MGGSWGRVSYSNACEPGNLPYSVWKGQGRKSQKFGIRAGGEKADPNVSLSADERNIGGLGIYIVKKTMDKVEYEYKDNQNILTITKNINV